VRQLTRLETLRLRVLEVLLLLSFQLLDLLGALVQLLVLRGGGGLGGLEVRLDLLEL
jgi:hypothetical protein